MYGGRDWMREALRNRTRQGGDNKTLTHLFCQRLSLQLDQVAAEELRDAQQNATPVREVERNQFVAETPHPAEEQEASTTKSQDTKLAKKDKNLKRLWTDLGLEAPTEACIEAARHKQSVAEAEKRKRKHQRPSLVKHQALVMRRQGWRVAERRYRCMQGTWG